MSTTFGMVKEVKSVRDSLPNLVRQLCVTSVLKTYQHLELWLLRRLLLDNLLFETAGGQIGAAAG